MPCPEVWAGPRKPVKICQLSKDLLPPCTTTYKTEILRMRNYKGLEFTYGECVCSCLTWCFLLGFQVEMRAWRKQRPWAFCPSVSSTCASYSPICSFWEHPRPCLREAFYRWVPGFLPSLTEFLQRHVRFKHL